MELPAKVALDVRKPEFRRWQDNPEEPRDWAGVAEFLGLNGAEAFVDPAERLKEIRTAIQTALDWCISKDTIYLTPDGGSGNPIHVSDLATLLDFVSSLSYRFPKGLGG